MLHDPRHSSTRHTGARAAVRPLALVLALVSPCVAHAQSDVRLDPVVVTATRRAERSFELPASIDLITRPEIAEGEPMINLSESLVRVPGLVAANRQNYAQDLQISSRGFGARATFGVRGIRLYQDDIPATMPDGQGQTGSFQLLSVERIEVLRGPFSTLYGNASGGVISVFTESGTPEPELTVNAGGGSYGTWTAGIKATGTARGVGFVAALTQFDTDGFRPHSAAQRTLSVAKLTFNAGERTSVTVLGTNQDQPETQDPLGLTREQWEANPRQTASAALLFDTRKTVHQLQGGVRVDHALAENTTLRVTAYEGQRTVRQFLALTGLAPPTSSGGVTDLDRVYGGISVKLLHKATVAGGPLTTVVGVDYDEQNERRKGFVNAFGELGPLRRNEKDVVSSTDFYGQLEWWFLPKWSVTAGVRSSDVKFDSKDDYITATNPDDSGSATYRRTTPVAGIVFHARDELNLYATYGEGFETPTFAELAYRAAGTGLNFDLKPATSRAVEAGVKAIVARSHRLNAALFAIDTNDEIVTAFATGGRTVFKNAGKTRRRGAELAYDGDFGHGVTVHAAYSWLSAEFASDSTSGEPPVTVHAGAKIPGVPAQTGYAEFVWRPAPVPWLSAALEAQYESKIYVNDRNSDATPSWAIANVRVAAEQRLGNYTLSGFVRINNVTDRSYVGSVIVGDTNSRFFEPAPGRNLFVGASVRAKL